MRYAFTEYDKGVEKKDIAAALNAQGHRYKGKTFDKWVVNDKYTGVFEFGGRVCDNMYPQIIDTALFERVQKRLQKNRYFAGGKATARVTYYLTGKAKCGYCDTDMLSDGGVSRLGKTHQYYACKQKKKSKCEKKRNDKNELELYTTVTVHDFLGDPKNAEIAVNDTLKYYAQRTCEESLRSVEVKITKARKEVDELATAFVKAQSVLLQTTIEKKMKEYETLLNDLLTQQAQLEIERGWCVNRRDLLDFISELLKGDPNDKEHQQKIIDNLVYRVYVYDGYKVVYINLSGGRGFEGDRITLADTENAVKSVLDVRTQFLPPRQYDKNRHDTSMYCVDFNLG